MTKILSTMMKLAAKIVNSQTQSTSAYRKVRLKCERGRSLKRLVSNEVVVITLCLIFIISRVSCNEARNNRPPRFLIDNQHSEIVLRLKEGPDTPVGTFKVVLVLIKNIFFLSRTFFSSSPFTNKQAA